MIQMTDIKFYKDEALTCAIPILEKGFIIDRPMMVKTKLGDKTFYMEQLINGTVNSDEDLELEFDFIYPEMIQAFTSNTWIDTLEIICRGVYIQDPANLVHCVFTYKDLIVSQVRYKFDTDSTFIIHLTNGAFV